MNDYKGEKDYFEKKINQFEYGLTFAQQDFIAKNWQEKHMLQLARETFKEDSLTEKDLEYHNVRKFIAKIKRGVPGLELNEIQLRFLEENSHAMNAFQLAQELFPDRDIKPLSSETQRVSSYLKAIGLTEDSSNSGVAEEYRPPKSESVIIRKINKADTNAYFDQNDLTPAQKNCIKALKGYLQSIRFKSFINMLESFELKEYFEEEFIKATYNKPDLNSEELNMYITLCLEYVNQQRIEKQKVLISQKIDEYLESDGDEDDKTVFYENLKLYDSRENELKESKKRATDLQTRLSSTRAMRLEKEAKVNESLSKFVDDWRSEEGRQRALVIAEAKNLELKDEQNRIEDMSEYIANIMGIGKDELLNM